MARRPAARRHRPGLQKRLAFALLGLAASGLQAAPARATPELVLLMRHGLKSGQANDYNLSPQGLERAMALATLLPRCFGRPSRIRTFFLDPETSKNARSYQTAVPLAVATGVNITIDLASRENSFRSGRHILTDPAFDGRRVVVFWEHRRLPELAAGLGWPTMAPINDDDFDQLIVLRYRPGAAQPQVDHYSQSRLLADQQRCEPPQAPRHDPPREGRPAAPLSPLRDGQPPQPTPALP
jgi:hypothetical protein